MSKRHQISTTVSPHTWYQVHRLATEYGTIREVITRAVMLLDAEYWQSVEAQAPTEDDHCAERARWNATDESH